MKKLRNRKGFTLIEMMAVIAIIAVLVSIIMPTFGETKNKANAATNAANLRAVESQLAQLLVTNPEAFEKDGIEAIEANIRDVFNVGLKALEKSAEWLQDKLNKYGAFVPSWIKQPVIDELEDVKKDIRNTEIAREHAADMARYGFTAVNGVIELNGITISAPTSKGLSVDGLEMDEGIEMTVFVSDTQIYATYNGLMSGCFATVADKGSTAEINEGQGAHDFIDNDGDYICDYCGNNDSH